MAAISGEIKSPSRQVADVGTQYLIPSGLVSGAITALLSYFFKLPPEIASAIAVILFAIINAIEVYIIEKRK